MPARTIRITDAVLYDYLQEKIDSSARHRNLIQQSKKAAKRYKTHDIRIQAGIGGDAMMAAGSAVYLASAATAVAVLQGSLAASTATTTAAVGGAFVVTPILLINGMLRSINEAKLAAMIVQRHAAMPILLALGESRLAQDFFAITPLPGRISLTYEVLGDQWCRPAANGEIIGD